MSRGPARPHSNRFGRGGAYRCRSCGKLTRETGGDESSVELCRSCLQEAEMENAHSDGYHDDAPNPECPDCAPQEVTP